MAPSAINQPENDRTNQNGHGKAAPKLRREPLKNSGSIEHLEYVDVTPIIGREYPTAKIKDILHAPNAEQQLRDTTEGKRSAYLSTIVSWEHH